MLCSIMNVQELVEKYFDQIEIEDTAYVAVNDTVSDAAYLLLNLPTEMLREYQQLNGQRKKLPDGAEFWKETGLVRKLRNFKKHQNIGHTPLGDILDYLDRDVLGTYQELKNPERIRLTITEIPEFYPE